MKNAIIFLIIAIVAIGGLIVYNNFKGNTPPPTVATTSTNTAVKPTPTPTPTPTQPTTTTPTPSPTSTTTTTPTQPTTPSTPISTDLPPIDATWGTFTSRNGAWTFQYPNKGRFAPEWEQFYVPLAGNATYKVSNDCVFDANFSDTTQTSFTANGTAFCHATIEDHAMSHTYMTDTYATKYGNQYLVLQFKKSAISQPIGLVEGCNPGSTKPACQPFDRNMYEATLDQTMSTFKFNTTTN